MKRIHKLRSNSFLYYPTILLGILFTISPLLLIKLIAGIAAAAIMLFLDKFWWASILAVFTFFITWGLLFPLGKYLTGKGLLLSEFSRRYKKSYIAEYGENIKKPSFEEFNLRAEDYYSYNRKFKLDPELSFLTIPIVLIFLLNFTSKRGAIPFILSLLVAFVTYFITKYFVLFINYKILSKHPKYNNIQSYNKADFIYKKVQEEIKAIQNSFKGWDD